MELSAEIGNGGLEIKCIFTHNTQTAHEAVSTDISFKSEDGSHILYPK